MMNELYTNLKELVSSDKSFASNLEKACEKSILEKIQQKQRGYLDDCGKHSLEFASCIMIIARN